jgi:hypothetical protein
MKVFAGSSNMGLAREIAAYLQIDLGKCVLERFSDGGLTRPDMDGLWPVSSSSSSCLAISSP